MDDSKNIVPFSTNQEVERVAAEWIAKTESGELSPEDRSALQQWLAQSPQHRKAMQRLSMLWQGFDILEQLNCLDTPPDRIQFMANWRSLAAIAATIIVAFTLLLNLIPSAGTQHEHFATLVGERKTIDLADGSTIILNTNSAVDVDLDRNIRHIHLLKGEAHFDVAKDPERPFQVYAANGIVKAIGTAFTVFIHDKHDVEVTVTHGVVQLLASQPALDETSPQKSLGALTVGQSALFSDRLEHVAEVTDEEISRKLLWREGFLAFSGEPLSKVVKDISRYTDLKIEIEDPSLQTIPIGGYFKTGDVESLFGALNTIFGIEAHYTDATHIKLIKSS